MLSMNSRENDVNDKDTMQIFSAIGVNHTAPWLQVSWPLLMLCLVYNSVKEKKFTAHQPYLCE